MCSYGSVSVAKFGQELQRNQFSTKNSSKSHRGRVFFYKTWKTAEYFFFNFIEFLFFIVSFWAHLRESLDEKGFIFNSQNISIEYADIREKIATKKHCALSTIGPNVSRDLVIAKALATYGNAYKIN